MKEKLNPHNRTTGREPMTAKHPLRGAWLRRGILAVLLAAAVILLGNGSLPSRRAEKTEPVQTAAPAAPAAEDRRMVREKAYDKDVAALEGLLESGAADADTQAQAARSLAELIAAHQSEIAVETALAQAGYDPCLAVMNGGALTVMVAESAIDAESSAVILSLCMAHAEVDAANIRIMAMLP